jgi:hypothetical protein
VAISYIRDVIGALLGGEFRERLGDGFDECIEFRAAARRKAAFSFAKACSIGFRSGL